MRHLTLWALAAAIGSPAAAQTEAIRLIIRGDDFGYTHASNQAMVEAFERGVMTSASLLATGPWFAETAALVRERPEWNVGVHLTITSEWNRLRWRPVSPISAVPSLVAPDGYLWGFGYGRPRPGGLPADGAPWAEHEPDPKQVEKEFRAQIQRALDLGVQPDYVDCHMGMGCRESLLPVTRRLAAEFCLGVSGQNDERRLNPRFEDLSPAGVKRTLLAAIESLAPGLWLYVGHPAVDSSELRSVDSNDGGWWGERRSSVLAAWTDPDVRSLLKAREVELISMRNLTSDLPCRAR